MRRPPALLWALSGLLAVYLAAPFVAGLTRLGAADWTGADVSGLLHAAGVSILSATLSTALVAFSGVPLGYVLARVPSRALGVVGFVVQLPLALPPLASGVLLLFLLGYASPIGRLTHGALTDSFTGIVLAEAFVAAPFLIIAARSAFSSLDPALEDVAATLGHGPWAVFRKVSLALSWRTLLAGLLLAWLRAFGEFGATVMVAYHPYSLPVFTYIAFGSSGLPAMLPVLLPTVLAAVLVMALSQATLSVAGRKTAPHDPPQPLPLSRAVQPAAGGSRLDVAGQRRLDDFTLDIAWSSSARRLAILGASGSGKSMTLRLIAGLDAGEGGARITFGSQRLDRLPPKARGVAYVPQSYGLLPHLTVARQVRFAADCDPALAAHWTARLGLTGLEARRSDELSLGQQQRVALARALSRPSARLVLLDEPFAALDTPLRARLRQELMALQAEMNATTILVTHDPAEAMLLADDLILLEAGRVLQVGPVCDVFARPINEAAARLLGAEAIGQGRVMPDGRIDIGDGVSLEAAGPALSPGARVGWSARPYQIRLTTENGNPATIIERGPVHDGQRRILVRLGGAELSLLADPSCPEVGPCRLSIDPQALQVWPRSASPSDEVRN
jgi:molybdate transport system permease protein